MPKITIITPCYNSSEYIVKTYDSVRFQSFQDWEWIVVDDFSSDNTFEIIKQMAEKDRRIKPFRNVKNSGASVSRNKGLDEATGEFIAFLDADDLWNQEKLSAQLTFMEKEKVVFSFHNYDMIDYQGCYNKSMTAPAVIKQSTLEMYNPIFTSSAMISKKTIGNIRFKTEFKRRQDYLFWYELIKVCELAKNVGMTLGSYRVGNKNSLSGNKFKNIPIQWRIYREDFKLSLPSAVKSICRYAIHGISKYFL